MGRVTHSAAILFAALISGTPAVATSDLEPTAFAAAEAEKVGYNARDPVCKYNVEQLAGCAIETVPNVYANSRYDLLTCSGGTTDSPNMSYFDAKDSKERVECQMSNTLAPGPNVGGDPYTASQLDLCSYVGTQVTSDTGKTCTHCHCPNGRYGVAW
jgi:hypothetical protein